MATAGRAPLVVIGMALLFVGGIASAIGGNMLLDDLRYWRESQRARGIVSDKTLRRATAGQNTAYEIAFRFSAGSQASNFVERVPVHVWERLERRSAIDVEYLPAETDRARLVRDRSRERNRALVALGIGAPLMIAGLLFAAAAFRRRRVAQEPDASAAHPVIPSPAAEPQSVLRIARRSSEFLTGAIFLVVGSPFLVAGVVLFHADWQFGNEARVTQGMVLTKSTRTSGRGSRTKHYEVTYRFSVGSETFEGDGEVSQALWTRLVERESVDVFYRPATPSSNQLEGQSQWFLKTLFTVVGAIFTGIGGMLLVRSFRHASLESRLQQTGLRASGNVTSLAPLNIKINSVQQWRLEYEYQDLHGVRHVGTLDLPAADALQLKVGDSGTVLYDSSQPAVAIWLGDERAI